MKERKPRRWIERMQIRCKDELSAWLFEKLAEDNKARGAFSVYIEKRLFDVQDSADLSFDLWWQWWNSRQPMSLRFLFIDPDNVRQTWGRANAIDLEERYGLR